MDHFCRYAIENVINKMSMSDADTIAKIPTPLKPMNAWWSNLVVGINVAKIEIDEIILVPLE